MIEGQEVQPSFMRDWIEELENQPSRAQAAVPFQPLFVSGPWVLPTRLPCSPYSGFLGLCLCWINCALAIFTVFPNWDI